MDNFPRQKLIEIVKQARALWRYKRLDVLNDADACEHVLYARCTRKYAREVNVLTTALRGGVPHKLQAMLGDSLTDMELEELTRELMDRYALRQEAARWAVYAWAEALSIEVPCTIFHCTWEVEVLGHASSDLENHWHPLGETPGDVIVPLGYDIGLRPKKMNRERFATWVRYLQDCERVKYLNLTGQEIEDENLTLLGRFPNLERLDLANTNINDNGLKHLRQTKRLKHLDLSNCCWISDQGMEALSALSYLTSLNLAETRITNEGLAHLSELTYLQYLVLNKTSLEGVALTPLDGLHALIYLDLSGTNIEDAALASLHNCPNLETLWLDDCSRITGAGLAHLRPLKNLRRLGLSGTEVDDTSVEKHLIQLGLKGIKLGRCWNVSDTLKTHLRRSGIKILD
ncbi:MAG: leucine-rich repeat domain-containing protein [Anaerolineae bacterium]